MTNRDRYGTLAQPEARTRIEVIENPVTIVRASHRIWRRTIVPHSWNGEASLGDLVEPLYQEAVRLLEPHADRFEHLSHDELKAALAAIEWPGNMQVESRNYVLNGVYLSALLNSTRLPELHGKFSAVYLGHKLAPGKRLILRKGSNVGNLGDAAQGTIINYGAAHSMAAEADGGIQVNYGDVDTLGLWACAGVRLNYGTAHKLAEGASGGVAVNYGKTERQGHDVRGGQVGGEADGGVQANLGTAHGMGAGARGGIQANYGSLYWMDYRKNGSSRLSLGTVRKEYWRNHQTRRLPKLAPPLQKLERHLRKPLRFADLTPRPAATAIEAHDWAAFEAKALEISKDIHQVHYE